MLLEDFERKFKPDKCEEYYMIDNKIALNNLILESRITLPKEQILNDDEDSIMTYCVFKLTTHLRQMADKIYEYSRL